MVVVIAAVFRDSVPPDKVHFLYFALAASLTTTFVQIIIEIVMVTRYNNGGSQQWLSGCEILSACSMEQGPSSATSQIYNEVENMMKIVVAEIVGNVFNLILMAASTYQIHQEFVQSARPPVASSPAVPTSTRPHVILCVNCFEMLLEVGQVVCSALALQSMEGSIRPVNELFDNLVGKHSDSAGLCVLPCCGSSSSKRIVC